MWQRKFIIQNQKQKLYYFSSYCQKWYDQLWWSCYAIYDTYDISINNLQISHEVRDITEFNDWIGRSQPQPLLAYGVSMAVGHAPPVVKIEQKSGGTAKDPMGWTLYKNNNSRALKVQPRVNGPSFSMMCNYMFQQSWELQTSCVPTSQTQIQLNIGTLYIGDGAINAFMVQQPIRWVQYADENDLRFPRSMQSYRLRFQGKGQELHGFTWQQVDTIQILSLNYRLVTIRSPLKTPDNEPHCMVDRAPLWRGSTRELVAQGCYSAAKLVDGREAWLMRSTQTFFRWENDWGASICYLDEFVPWVGQCGDEFNEASQSDWFAEKSIRMQTNKKCLGVKNAPVNQVCGLNANASGSSRWAMKDNEFCNPFAKAVTPFYWKPNDAKMSYSITFKDKFVILDSMEFTFQFAPKIFKVTCYSNIVNSFQDVAFIKTGGKKNFKIQFLPEPCDTMTIQIIEFDPDAQKCKEGVCNGILTLKLNSKSTGLGQVECEEKDPKKVDRRWYLEPSDISQIALIRKSKIDQILKRNEFLIKMTDMQFLNLRVTEMAEGFPPMKTANLAEDLTFGVEKCEKGPCLEQLKGPNLPSLQKDLMETKPRFGKSALKGYFSGETKNKPADSCSFVQSETKLKINGFQWIKNACSKDPHKVQCDFTSKPFKGLIIDNQHEFKGINIREAHAMDPENFIKHCINTGFHLPNTETLQDLMTIALVAMMQDFNQHKGRGVLIGFDFSCIKDNKICNGEWHSLDGTMSLMAAAKKFNAMLGKEFTPIRNNEALVLSGGVIKTMTFSTAYINSVPCQTNQETLFNEIACSMTFSDISALDIHHVMCKSDCKKEAYFLAGSSIQSDNSSVCKAILHNGVYIARGSQVQAAISQQKGLMNSFLPEEKNGIVSSALKTQMKAWTIAPDFNPDEECPEAIHSNKTQVSFVQNVNIDTTRMSAEDQAVLMKLLRKNRTALLPDSDNYSDSGNASNDGNKITGFRNRSIQGRESGSNSIQAPDSDYTKPLSSSSRFQNDAVVKYNAEKLSQNNRTIKENTYLNDKAKNIRYDTSSYRHKKKNLSKRLINNQKFLATNKNVEKWGRNIKQSNMNSQTQRPLRATNKLHTQKVQSKFRLKELEFPLPLSNKRFREEQYKHNQPPKETKINPISYEEWKFKQSNTNNSSDVLVNGKIISKKKFFASDEQKRKKKYQNRTKIEEIGSQMFFVLEGDESNLRGAVEAIDNSSEVGIAKELMQNVRDNQSVLSKEMKIDMDSLLIAEKLYPGQKEDQNILNLFALSVLRTANKDLKAAEKTLWMLEDKQLNMFVQIDVDYGVDIVDGVSIPLPDVWHVQQPAQSLSEGDVNFKITKQDTAPHSQAIRLNTDVTNTNNGQGVIVTSRQHRIFDGSFHVSFRIPDKKGVQGFVWRQGDMFSHQGIKFLQDEQKVLVQLNTSFEFRVLQSENIDISSEIWYRLVIKTYKQIIEIQFDEEDTIIEELDEDAREDELSVDPTWTVQHAGIKEGRVGFFCSDCKGLLVSGLQLWADKCWIKPSNQDSWYIHSPKSARYIENYKPEVASKFRNWKHTATQNAGKWIWAGSTNGKLDALTVASDPFWLNGFIAPAQVAQLKDPTLWCQNYCTNSTAFLFESTESGGCIGISLKFRGPSTTQFMVFTKGKKNRKDTFHLISGLTVPVKLTKVELNDKLLPSQWQTVKAKMVNNKVSVMLNKVSILNEYLIEEEFVKMNGTQGVGYNGLKAQFSEMNMGVVIPPVKPKPSSNTSNKSNSDAEVPDAEPSGEGQAEEQEEQEQEEGNQVEELEDYKCLKTNDNATRTKFCDAEFGGDQSNTKTCVDTFCSFCCTTQSKETLTCNAKCNEMTIKVDLPETKQVNCTNQEGDSNTVNLEGCTKCCSSLDVRIISEQSIKNCEKLCQGKFYKPIELNQGIEGHQLSQFTNGQD